MLTPMRLCSAALVAATALAAQPATAQVQKSGNFLSLDLAMEAAAAAAQACEAKGWPVSVSVVDAAGNVKLQAKGDHSTIHTKDSSFRKAYTMVTMGPLFGFDALGAWVEKLKTNPYASTYATLPNMLLFARRSCRQDPGRNRRRNRSWRGPGRREGRGVCRGGSGENPGPATLTAPGSSSRKPKYGYCHDQTALHQGVPTRRQLRSIALADAYLAQLGLGDAGLVVDEIDLWQRMPNFRWQQG